MNYVKGDALKIFQDSTTEAILIHQVNCQGVMGSGIAKQIKDQYPKHFEDYVQTIEYIKQNGGIMLGSGFGTLVSEEPKKGIRGIFGQDQFGTETRKTNYAALLYQITHLVSEMSEAEVIGDISVIIPKYIGCGLGGGDWGLVETYLLDLEAMTGVEFICVEYER